MVSALLFNMTNRQKICDRIATLRNCPQAKTEQRIAGPLDGVDITRQLLLDLHRKDFNLILLNVLRPLFCALTLG